MNTADKRSVATDALETLGHIITENEKRDAIHLAVEPAIAGEKLWPGDHVFIDSNKVAFRNNSNGVGIVDPFLLGPVQQNERFWLVVYPRKITSLRHVWTHPSIDTEETLPIIDPTGTSEAWMRRWAEKYLTDDYDSYLTPEGAYEFALRIGHDLFVGSHEDAPEHIDSEWWDHWERITGEVGDREAYFSCAC